MVARYKKYEEGDSCFFHVFQKETIIDKSFPYTGCLRFIASFSKREDADKCAASCENTRIVALTKYRRHPVWRTFYAAKKLGSLLKTNVGLFDIDGPVWSFLGPCTCLDLSGRKE